MRINSFVTRVLNVASTLTFVGLGLIAANAQANTANLTFNSPQVSATGGSLNIAGGLGLSANQSANFSSGSVTFDFTASNMTNYTGYNSSYINGGNYSGCSWYGCWGWNNTYSTGYQYAAQIQNVTVGIGQTTQAAFAPIFYFNNNPGAQNNNNSYAYGTMSGGSFAATLNLDPTAFANLNKNGSLPFQVAYSNAGITLDNANFTGTYSAVATVPEPSTYGMLLAGLGLIGFIAYRRKDDASSMMMAA